MICVVLARLLLGGCPQDDAKVQESLDATVRALYKGMEDGTGEQQLRAMREVLPTKKDVDVLFPNHSEKAWPLMKKYLEEMEKHLDQVAKELKAGGAVTKVEMIDVRKKKAEEFEKVLAWIPREIPVYTTVVHKGDSQSIGAVYFQVNGRWRFYRDLSDLPEMIGK